MNFRAAAPHKIATERHSWYVRLMAVGLVAAIPPAFVLSFKRAMVELSSRLLNQRQRAPTLITTLNLYTGDFNITILSGNVIVIGDIPCGC